MIAPSAGIRLSFGLVLALGATVARADRPLTEEEVKLKYQSAACASPSGWVQVKYGTALLEVRCNSSPPPPEPTRARPAKAPVKDESPEGYLRTRWGMNKSDVRKLYPDLRGSGDILWHVAMVSGYRAITSFHFRNNSLHRVIVSFRPPGGERGEPSCFQRIRDALIEKYGQPQEEEGSTWETDETRIVLSLNTAAVLNRLTAVYTRKGVPEPAAEEQAPDEDSNGL